MLNSREIPASPATAHSFYVNLIKAGYTSLADYMVEEEVIKSVKLEEVVFYGQEKLVKNAKKGAFVKVTRKRD